MALKQTFDLTVEIVSPTHIGSGQRLKANLDYSVRGSDVFVIDLNQLEQISDLDLLGQLEKGLNTLNPAQLNSLAAYRLRGRVEKEIQAHIKDGAGRAYLPGSSLKGAIRSALGWHFFGQLPDNHDVLKAIRDSPRREPDNNLEKTFFAPKANPGMTPNYDLLRAMQVSDLYPVKSSNDSYLELRDVLLYVLNRRGWLAPRVNNGLGQLEMLKVGTRFEGKLTLDEFLWQDRRASELKMAEGAKVFEQLGKLIQDRSWVYTEFQMDFIEACERDDVTDDVFDWYKKLRLSFDGLGDNQALIPIGWGAGWPSKTYADRLTAQASWSQVRRDYRLGHEPWDDEFPLNRKLVLKAGQPRPSASSQSPVIEAPTGWVKLTLDRRN